MIKNIIDSYDQTNIYLLKNNIKNPKAVVIIVHGLAEYCERYNYLTEHLNNENFSVFRFDLRGHGKSGSLKGWVDDYNSYIKDLDLVVDTAKNDYPDKPIFILGHSMGGFITAAYGIKFAEKIDGIVLSAAALETPEEAKGLKRIFIKVMNKISPNFKMKNTLGNLLSRDEDVVKSYNNDPLVLKAITIKLYYEFLLKGIDWLKENMYNFKVDCLLLHGKEDKIINYKSSLNFEKVISSKNKKSIIYEDLYHEIFNEKEKNIVIKDLIIWLNRQV